MTYHTCCPEVKVTYMIVSSVNAHDLENLYTTYDHCMLIDGGTESCMPESFMLKRSAIMVIIYLLVGNVTLGPTKI